MDEEPRRGGLLLRRLGLSALSLLLIVATDRILKAHYYSKTYRYYETGEVYVEDENTMLLFSPDRNLFWKIKPNIRLKITEDPEQYDLYTVDSKPGTYFFVVQSNSHGWNSPEVDRAKPAGTKRLVTLGDSRTMAEGVPFESLYSRRLENLLNADESIPEPYQVINAGVSGYSSYQGLTQLKRDLLAYEPDVVTILFGINDQDTDPGLSDRERAPGFNSAFQTLRGWANRSMIYYALNRQALRLKATLYGKTPRVPTPKVVDGVPVRRVSFAEYEENLDEFADLGEQHGFRPIFVIVPTSPYAFYPSLMTENVSDFRPEDLARFGEAIKSYSAGRYAEAVATLEEIEDEHQLSAVHRLLGQCFQQLERYEEAHEQFVTVNRKIIFRRYEDTVRAVAARRGVTLVDLTPEFTSITSEMLYVDDMHPSEYGQGLIAQRIAEALSTSSSDPRGE